MSNKQLLLVHNHNSDLVLIQEMMGNNVALCDSLYKMLSGWNFLGIDSQGVSGGVLTGWKEDLTLLNSFAVPSRLMVEVFIRSLDKNFKVLSIYGPYEGKHAFWEKNFNSSLLMHNNLILVGDLNFNLNRGEIWGVLARPEPLTYFFNQSLDCVGLVDLAPMDIKPTWVNNKKECNSF
jgi:hypothetical protein